LFAVLQMAGEAAQALVYANRSAVLTRVHLPRGKRGVALIAERLPLVGTHLHHACPFQHEGQRQVADCNMVKFAAVKKRKRRSSNFLLWALIGCNHWLCKRSPLTVNLVAR